MTTIDFAGQVGGKDAHPVFPPHFKALKSAAKDHSLPGVPTTELTFILRMDGEISTYGPSGVGPIAVDRDGSVSVDLQLSIEDRPDMKRVIPRYMLASVAHLQDRLPGLEPDTLLKDLEQFIEAYLAALDTQTPTSPGK